MRTALAASAQKLSDKAWREAFYHSKKKGSSGLGKSSDSTSSGADSHRSEGGDSHRGGFGWLKRAFSRDSNSSPRSQLASSSGSDKPKSALEKRLEAAQHRRHDGEKAEEDNEDHQDAAYIDLSANAPAPEEPQPAAKAAAASSGAGAGRTSARMKSELEEEETEEEREKRDARVKKIALERTHAAKRAAADRRAKEQKEADDQAAAAELVADVGTEEHPGEWWFVREGAAEAGGGLGGDNAEIHGPYQNKEMRLRYRKGTVHETTLVRFLPFEADGHPPTAEEQQGKPFAPLQELCTAAGPPFMEA